MSNNFSPAAVLYDAAGNPVAITLEGGLYKLQAIVSDGGSSITVDGTVTADQGTAGAVANAWPIKVTDGVDTAGVAPASTAAVALDPSLVVALSPNTPLPAGTNAIGTVTAVQAVAANLNTLAAQGAAGAVANAWPTKVTDGVDTAAVAPASTAVQSTDPALAVGLSPNSPLPAGSNQIGAVAQGTAAPLAGAWPVIVTNASGLVATVTEQNNTNSVAVESRPMLLVLRAILGELEIIRRQMATITDEDDPL